MTRQICLPGQEHVAEGPHDQTGMYLAHHAFRRDLGRFAEAVRRTPVAEDGTWRALADRWTTFTVTLHHHHRVEDESIWPIVVGHAESLGRVTALETLDAMEAEHATIDPGLERCTEGFARMIDHPCEDHRAALTLRVTDVRAALLDHLRHEETEALPLLQELLDAEEFAAAERAAEAAYPVSMLPFLLPWATAGVPDEVIGSFLGRPHRLLLRLLRGRFERAEAKAFRHA